MAKGLKSKLKADLEDEKKAVKDYGERKRELVDPEDKATIEEIQRDEKDHAKKLKKMVQKSVTKALGGMP